MLKTHVRTATIATMDAPPKTTVCSSAITIDSSVNEARPTTVSLLEWQAWGTDSPMPTQVAEIVEEMIVSDAHMNFRGLGGKLKVTRDEALEQLVRLRMDPVATCVVSWYEIDFGLQVLSSKVDFKTHEKHREKNRAFNDSEQKLQFFSARKIACRLLESRSYLCQRCWLPLEYCMCSRVVPCSLWHRIRFWLYMHPKDFLRENNTGKLLWQVFGINSATLCIFGIAEHEEIMWKALMHSGRNNVWCLYPNKNAPSKSVEDSFAGNGPLSDQYSRDAGETLNFILIDGTWSNSAPMFRRLKERADLVWEDGLPCISLTTGASAMHKLRPQPSRDRTCTAAAATGLLDELHLFSQFKLGLDKQAEVVKNSIDVLMTSLTARRLHMGSSITRRKRHHNNFS